jgi:ribonuclease E
LEDGILEELYTERTSQNNWVGNIYKGKIVNIEPSIQAAFVDFGVGRNGFLHISDIEPEYFRQAGYDPADILSGKNFGIDDEEGGGDQDPPQRSRGPNPRGGKLRSGRPRFKPPIQEIFKRGDEVVVQVIKEGIGTKGPTLSTYVSIPGRYLVLMPSLGRVGISRKIEDEVERKKLKSTMHEINIPKGVGFIVRTAAQERNRKELYRDVAYLLRLWKVLAKRIKNQPGPCDVYEESDIMIRTIRDTFTEDIDSILIDSPDAFQRAKEFMELVMPKYADRIELYDSREPLFHRFKLEQEIARIHQRVVPLKGGGSIVIDPTEALVAIDVNSGNFRGGDENAEENAFHLNLAASKEIARQLRLRDLGGVIVNDFIDMRKESHRRKVEKSLSDAMKRDRARTKILRTSPFGLIEMTRQRIRPSFKRSVYEDCPCCRGRALVKTAESMAIEVTRILMLASQHQGVARINVRVNENVAAYLNNRKRRELIQLEESSGVAILILGSDSQFPEFLEIDCRDKDNGIVTVPFVLSQ